MAAIVAPVEALARSAQASWDEELASIAAPAPLQQTWAWGEAQSRLGWRVERLRLDGGVRALVLLRGVGPFEWAYAPRGPVPASLEAVEQLVAWARGRRLAMLRVEPEGPPDLGTALGAAGFRRGELSEPRHTSIVLLHADETLLASFRSGVRQKVRKAERSGVTIEGCRADRQLLDLIQLTYRRHGILMKTDLVEALADCLPDSRAYLARVDAQVVAGILVARHGRRAYYVAGGSSGLRRETMPNHALQWRAMRDAYLDGCVDYDLCGTPPPDQPNHPWHGLHQFKSGFGGREVEYAGPWDLVLSGHADKVMRGTHWMLLRANRLGHRAGRLLARR